MKMKELEGFLLLIVTTVTKFCNGNSKIYIFIKLVKVFFYCRKMLSALSCIYIGF